MGGSQARSLSHMVRSQANERDASNKKWKGPEYQYSWLSSDPMQLMCARTHTHTHTHTHAHAHAHTAMKLFLQKILDPVLGKFTSR